MLIEQTIRTLDNCDTCAASECGAWRRISDWLPGIRHRCCSRLGNILLPLMRRFACVAPISACLRCEHDNHSIARLSHYVNGHKVAEAAICGQVSLKSSTTLLWPGRAENTFKIYIKKRCHNGAQIFGDACKGPCGIFLCMSKIQSMRLLCRNSLLRCTCHNKMFCGQDVI